MKTNSTCNIKFQGKSRTNSYTTHQQKVMRDMKRAAVQNGWKDIYTGKPFSTENLPTIEHIIPHSQKDSDRIKAMSQKGFQLNGLDNIFPAGNDGNSVRGNKSMKKAISEDPRILDRFLKEVPKYENHKSDLIDGKAWVKKLMKTFHEEISGLCSDIKTRQIKF